jgi:hypothetical protein
MSWAALTIVVLVCVGLVISSLLPAGTPEGMRRIKCPRCGNEQNIAADSPSYECWQCKQVSLTPCTPIERDKRIREEIRWGMLDD